MFIYQNPDLIGHSLTSLPDRLWDFSNASLSYYTKYDAKYREIKRNWIIMQDVRYEIKNDREYTIINRSELIGENLVIDAIEWVFRRIFFKGAAVFSQLTLAPIGFVAKITHFVAIRSLKEAQTSSAKC